MKQIFKRGDQKRFRRFVTPEDCAIFTHASKAEGGGLVHPVYATFAIARDAEWACRLFVLDMKEDNEEGIGTHISVYHLSPAKIGETVTFTAVVANIGANSILCDFEVKVGKRIIARGQQEQKVLLKQKIQEIFAGS